MRSCKSWRWRESTRQDLEARSPTTCREVVEEGEEEVQETPSGRRKDGSRRSTTAGSRAEGREVERERDGVRARGGGGERDGRRSRGGGRRGGRGGGGGRGREEERGGRKGGGGWGGGGGK